jgi:hypothetical protein
LQCGQVGDIRDAEIGVAIDVRAIACGEIVHDGDLVTACEKRVDDMAAKKTGTAGHEDTQLLAAPLTALCTAYARQLRWLVVDELVEEMVDKGSTRRSASTLAFRKARWASPATRSRRRPQYLFEHLF